MRLEIGGGTNRLWPDAKQVDPKHGDPGLCSLVQDGIDLPDDSIEAAIASHVMEHIASGDDRIRALNEVHRVLVARGTFEIIVPTIGHTGDAGPVMHGWQGWADPTHVSFWWYPESFYYLAGGPWSAHADYGLRLWELGEMELRDGWEARVTLVKP